MTQVKPHKSFIRRDTLINIENTIKKTWEIENPFEIDAPEDTTKPKYFITFPYPYMNGRLHLGHAFSLTKTEFAARFHKLLGENVLYPFGFHCTGMPIVAAANKLKRELLDFGNPPVFPVFEKKEIVEKKEKDTTKFSSSKSKVAAKTGDVVYQYNIMKGMGIPETEISKFTDPYYWVNYFPPLGKSDLIDFGSAIDFRRSFVTTDINPFYDSFIRWQFNRLYDLGYLKFLKRFSIFSISDNQPCADHERSEGEGVKPQVYTLIKMQVQSPYPKCLEALKEKKIYLAPVTLRPETMYGQTNVWVLPEGEYGAFEMNSNEVIVCTDRAAQNLAFQEAFAEFGKTKKLASFTGADLIGTCVNAPNGVKYKNVYVLPMTTVSTKKGTGIVTSVPSDSPDDLMSFNMCKKKKEWRDKWGITDEMIMPFEVVPIINVPDISDVSAVTICEKLKVTGPNDTKLLAEAKEIVYNKGFYDGTLIVGPHAGKKVIAVKDIVANEIVKDGLGFKYAEPESLVVTRGGEECVVALTDQWFLKYGEDEWKQKVEDHVKTSLQTFNPSTKNLFLGTISWLKEWACSREYGLGTKLPFDERYLIESLSDSTIYMAYYTFAHILQNGNLQGDVKNGPVKPVDLTKSVWDYIFVDGPYPEDSKIEKTILNKMKHEFLYWYGVDLRTSGKDLIQNHLTMFLYNHAAIFPQKNMPKAIFANGHVLVDGEKMSKSKGNFLLLGQTIKDYSCDATRIALADAGDGLEDANFLRQTADDSIVRLTNYLTWVQEMLDTKLRTDGDTFADKSFEHRMRQAIHHAKDAYANMKFRDALRFAWYDFQTCKDDYKVDCDVNGMRHDLVMRFIELQCVIMAPITPHVSQHVWGLLKKDKFNSQVWPVVDEADIRTLRTYDYYRTAVHGFRVKLEKEEENWKKKNKTPFVKPEEAYVYICVEYSSWQKKALGLLREIVGKTNEIPKDIAGKLKPEFDGKEFQNVMTFVSFMKEEFEKYGISSLGDESPNDEVKILSENVNMMTKTLGVKKVTIYASHDKNIVDPSNRAPLTSTGKPQISFVYPTTK